MNRDLEEFIGKVENKKKSMKKIDYDAIASEAQEEYNKSKKKKPNKNKYAFAKAALRRVSSWWWAMSEAMDRAKVSRGVWKCAHCDGHFKKNEIQKDHIKPVVSTDGGVNDMNTYIETLFCEPENIQILCKPCHQVKSSTEQVLRKEVNKAKRKAKKNDN